ncbi:MAG: hypothetical protein ACREJB_04295 [Planctomycetaceae bacterium]
MQSPTSALARLALAGTVVLLAMPVGVEAGDFGDRVRNLFGGSQESPSEPQSAPETAPPYNPLGKLLSGRLSAPRQPPQRRRPVVQPVAHDAPQYAPAPIAAAPAPLVSHPAPHYAGPSYPMVVDGAYHGGGHWNAWDAYPSDCGAYCPMPGGFRCHHCHDDDECEGNGDYDPNAPRSGLWCRYGYFMPTGCCGYGCQPMGHYHMGYAVNPWYFDPRDGRVYAAQYYNMPMAVPLAPNVGHTYNYSWGIPSSRLTPISRHVPQQRIVFPY